MSGYEESQEWTNMGEHCSNTEFSSAAETVQRNCKSKAVRDRYSILTSKQKQKLRDEENCLQNRINQVAKKTFPIVDSTIVIAYRMQITDKTVTKISSQRKIRRLTGKLHCLNFVFPVKNETLGPVCSGCETSFSMLKFPTVSFETAIERRKFS